MDDTPKDDPLFKNPIKPPRANPDEFFDKANQMLDRMTPTMSYTPPQIITVSLSVTAAELEVIGRTLKDLRNER